MGLGCGNIDPWAGICMQGVIQVLDGKLNVLQGDELSPVVNTEGGREAISGAMAQNGEDYLLGLEGLQG